MVSEDEGEIPDYRHISEGEAKIGTFGCDEKSQGFGQVIPVIERILEGESTKERSSVKKVQGALEEYRMGQATKT